MAAPEIRRRRVVIVSFVVAALFLVGTLLTSFGRNGSAPGRSTTEQGAATRSTVAVRTSGPAAERSGVPVGFSHDEHGAVAAAIAYATASQRWLYFTDDEIRKAVSQIATPTAGARLADDVVRTVSSARKRLGASPGRVWWLVRPLARQVVLHQRDSARVAVWVVTVLSAAQVAAPQSEWMTVTVDLTWLGGDWRVDAVGNSPGPTPMTGPDDRPWDAQPFDDALSNFTRLDGEPVK